MTRRLSLRTRATLLGTLAMTILLTVGSVALVLTLEHRLTEASDETSRARVRELLELAHRGDLTATLRTFDDNGVAQVVDGQGRVLAASPNVAGRPAVAHLAAGRVPRQSTFRAPDDSEMETYRFWYAAGPAADGEVTAYVGDSLEQVSEASAQLRRTLWIGVPAAVLILAALIWWLLGRALGRLDRIRQEVDTITETNLDSRVAGDGAADEVGRLATTMNAMLSRLDAAATRQREFVADVSHDLQSPLAAQRVALELALARPGEVDGQALREEVLSATTDMERLVADLLVLASMDGGARPDAALIDLDVIVMEEAQRARPDRHVVLDTRAVSAAPAFAAAEDARRIVRNIVDNAVRHAAERVQLTVQVADKEWAEVRVHDDGPGVPEEHRDRMFERYYRADTARTRGGSGLGLAIARGLAERNGGTVELLDVRPGTEIRVRFPAARPS